MDYYAGAPEPDDYDSNGGMGSNNNGDFIKKYSSLILIGLAILIVILIIVFFTTTKNSKIDYNKLDNNSFLSNLEVFGGNINPDFSSEVFKYTIKATDSYISFNCEASSKKAKIEGCDEQVEVNKDELEYNIKVTAENGDITRYYLIIKK